MNWTIPSLNQSTSHRWNPGAFRAAAFTGRTGSRGVVLVVLLWVLAIVSLMTLSFTKSIRIEFNAARNNRDKVTAHYLARTGMAESIFRLLRRTAMPPLPQTVDMALLPPDDLDLGLVVSEYPQGKVTTRILDENGKINLNFTTEEVYRRLLAAIGVEKQRADVIIDSILDWVDADKNNRLNGAEDDYYLSLNPPYRAKNGPFDTVEELLLVQGVTPEIFYGVKVKDEQGRILERYGLVNYVTVYTFSIQINLNSAPLPVLMAIPDMEPQFAQTLYERRLVKPFMTMAEVTQTTPAALGRAVEWLSVGRKSNCYSLEATAEIAGSRIKNTLRSIIVIDPQEPAGYRTIYWNEMIR
jgi:general secretion pathway protein K